MAGHVIDVLSIVPRQRARTSWRAIHAFVQAPLAIAITIILGEVLSRRWARLSLMPK
jgi:hypothetical protein